MPRPPLFGTTASEACALAQHHTSRHPSSFLLFTLRASTLNCCYECCLVLPALDFVRDNESFQHRTVDHPCTLARWIPGPPRYDSLTCLTVLRAASPLFVPSSPSSLPTPHHTSKATVTGLLPRTRLHCLLRSVPGCSLHALLLLATSGCELHTSFRLFL
jgi:hypothetical protein